jgi:hypothetical protein
MTTPSQIILSTESAAPASAAPAPEAAPDLAAVTEQQFNQQMGSDLTADQLRDLAAGEVKAGRLTQEQADAALAADGVDGGAPAELDGFEGAKPHEYQMPGRGDYDPKQREADLRIRNWLSAAKFPREHGSSLATEASRVLKQHAELSDGEKEIFKRTEAVKLEKLWGPDFGKRVALARQLLTELDAKQPGILDFIDRSGLGNSAMIINLVYAQAERLAARSAKAGSVQARGV